jgi:hypothetical protein
LAGIEHHAIVIPHEDLTVALQALDDLQRGSAAHGAEPNLFPFRREPDLKMMLWQWFLR